MGNLACCYANILETAAVSLSQGAADASGNYPLYRLYDRDIGRIFQSASEAVTEVRADQGPAVINPVDTLFIPDGHNLQGLTLLLEYSDDDVTYTSAASWTQPDGNLIIQTFTAQTHRYWRLNISGATIAAQIAELFLTSTYTWERNPQNPGGPLEDLFNVQAETSAYGRDRFLIHGPSKRQRVYKEALASETQKASISALNDAWQAAKPFWLCDQDGIWIYGKLRKPLNLKKDGYGRYSFTFDFLEVIG